MRTEQTKQSIVAANVIGSTVFVRKRYARHAAHSRQMAGGSVRMIVELGTGIAAMASATKPEKRTTQNAKRSSWLSWVANVCAVASPTLVCSTSITSTRQRNFAPLIGSIPRAYECLRGRGKWITSRSFARTATASKRQKTAPPNAMAYAEPRLPGLDQPKPTQDAMAL